MLRKFSLLCMLSGWLVALPAFAATLPGKVVEEVDYTTHKGTAAVKLTFGDAIEYVSHSPQRLSSIFTIRFRFRDEALEKQFFPNESIKPPASSQVPLNFVVFTQDGIGPKIVLNFNKFVEMDVIPGPGRNDITLKFPAIKVKEPGKPVKEEVKEPAPAVAEDVPDKLMRLGKKAIQQGEPKKAIQIFTKLLGMPENKHQRQALELLGVARERNNQAAHAKSAYEDYIKKYPKGEDTDRVKQRLADLISFQMKPKKKLKEGKKERAELRGRSSTFGSIAQYYYYGENDIAETGTETDQSLLITQLSYNWRYRSDTYDIKTFFYGSHEYDFRTDESENFEINSLYVDLKNTQAGLYTKFGRQSASTAGVLGRFDGLLLGYEMFKKSRVNLVGGYPVEYSNKDSVITNKPFWGLSFEIDDVATNLDLAPYYIVQQVDGITDREAVGYEIRYFHPEKGNLFNLMDYDIVFNELNIFLLRGQYHIDDKNSLNLNYDKRKNPLLTSSNATLNELENNTVKELLDTLSEEEIQDMAKNKTGEATALTLGVSRLPNDYLQLNADVTRAEQTFKSIAPDTGELVDEEDSQNYYSAQLIFNRLFNTHDTYVLGIRYSDTTAYTNTLYSLAVRIPYGQTWRYDFRLRYDTRDDDSGSKLTRQRPSFKIDYRPTRSMSVQFEIGMEWWNYSGNTNNNDYQRGLANLGYRWNF